MQLESAKGGGAGFQKVPQAPPIGPMPSKYPPAGSLGALGEARGIGVGFNLDWFCCAPLNRCGEKTALPPAEWPHAFGNTPCVTNPLSNTPQANQLNVAPGKFQLSYITPCGGLENRQKNKQK